MSKQTELYIWGCNEKGQLCESKNSRYCSPRYILSPFPIQSVSLTSSSSLFLSESGEVYTTLYPTPEMLVSLKPYKIISISSGCFHSAVLTSTGMIFTWGTGESGALGLGDTQDYLVPQKLSLNRCTQISCGSRHTACIASGNLFTWGTGSSGQLGNGSSSIQLAPVKIFLEEPAEVSCGIQHTLLLKKNGEVMAFGGNSLGQLGTGNKRSSLLPVLIDSNLRFKKISCGSHSAAISEENKLYIWGTGLFGEWLSPKLITEINKPRDVNIAGSSGYAIDKEGNVWSWGSNGSGELGVGDFDQRTCINSIGILKNRSIKQICSGGNSVFAIAKDIESKRKSRKNNKENIPVKENLHKNEIEKLKGLVESKENKIKLLEGMINEEEIARIQQENDYFKTAFEEMKKFKQHCYTSLTQEVEKRKIAESFVKELHAEHKMLIGTIEDLEKTMSKLSGQCELYQEKAAQSENLLTKIKFLTEENSKLKSGHVVPEIASKRYTADLSFESITMASPNISLIFDKQKKGNSAEKYLRTSKSSSELLKLFEVPEPIRSISPAKAANEEITPLKNSVINEPQTPPTFRDGGIANSGAIKNSLSEIRARLNLLQENKVELEGKMNDFERKLREQL